MAYYIYCRLSLIEYMCWEINPFFVSILCFELSIIKGLLHANVIIHLYKYVLCYYTFIIYIFLLKHFTKIFI